MRPLKSNQGITGLEILAVSFFGSMMAMLLVGVFIGMEVQKALRKFNLAAYEEIQQGLGYQYSNNENLKRDLRLPPKG